MLSGECFIDLIFVFTLCHLETIPVFLSSQQTIYEKNMSHAELSEITEKKHVLNEL